MVTFTLSQRVWVFAKLPAIRAMRAKVFYVPTCQHAKRLSTSHFFVPACQSCASFSTWRADLPIGVPIFHFWRANVPTGMQIFQTFLLQNAKGNFYTLLWYEKFYIILDIIIIHVICVSIVHKNYTSFLYFMSC